MDWIRLLPTLWPIIISTNKEIIWEIPETPPVAKTKPFGSAGVVKQEKPKANIAAEIAHTKKPER